LTSTVGSEVAASDPHIFAIGSVRHVTYWGDDNRHYHLWFDRSWFGIDMTSASGSPEASGNPLVYSLGGVPHVVSRAGVDGHLHVTWFENGPWREHDLAQAETTPVATYRPAVYTIPSMAPRIVFRAVRGQIHEIARDTLASQNLSQAAGDAPPAAGSPDVFVI